MMIVESLFDMLNIFEDSEIAFQRMDDWKKTNSLKDTSVLTFWGEIINLHRNHC